MKIKRNSAPIKNMQGFTLIEVMISAVILFAALAISAELFKVSSLSADKAAKSAQFYQIHPAAMAAIKLDLKEKAYDKPKATFSGQVLLFGINYHWEANQLSLASPALYEGDITRGEPRFGLYNVNVSAQKLNKIQKFSFQVATW
jgi:prepilin-type N-terminal cleavage/methylation domain-containing protein